METKFNFNSSPCTSKEQSERLLALGLKKETADMCWHKMDKYSSWEEDVNSYEEWVTEILPLVPSNIDESLIPAWSLHRLLCLYNCHYLEFLGEEEIASTYDVVIEAIESAIKGGYFNEKYLE